MEPFVIRKTVAEKADVPVRSTKRKPARVRYPPVVVCTGLPPLVDGQIRCFLKLTIRRIRLVQLDLSEHNDLVIRIKWWGEPSDGAYFKPLCGRRRSGRQITARYAVRCGPKQFAAYLMDAGAMTLELLPDGLNDCVLGIANITDIVNLSVQRPVIGWYRVSTVGTHRHVADVHVNISFCELQDIYGESSGTGTGTELSQDESEGDVSSQLGVGRTYRVESGFSNDRPASGGHRVSFQQDISSSEPRTQATTVASNFTRTQPSTTNEVDRLIERAELLKMLVSPDPGQIPAASRRPVSDFDFDADNSISDSSLIADLYYGKSHPSKAKVDTSVQVTPNRSPKKTALRSPASSPVKSPGKSPRQEITRRVVSPKIVKFVDVEEKRGFPIELVSLLKRVKAVVISVHSLRLSAGDYRHFVSGSIPRRHMPGLSSLLSKPPRPLKITFFVHAQLPTGEMCELTRICGKTDLETNIIDFDQSEVIPIALNENRISLWLESAAVTFRLSCRHASVNRTQPVGVSVFSLESLFTSENFKSRHHAIISSRNPGSTMDIGIELEIAPATELDEPEEKYDRPKSFERPPRSPSPAKSLKENESRKSVSTQPQRIETPTAPTPVPATPLVFMFCVSEVEFFDSFVSRMLMASSLAQGMNSRDIVTNRWDVYLTAAAFSQPRRSSSRRAVILTEKQSVSFSPKLQLYYVYNLDEATAARFEDNHLIVELRRHVLPDGEDQLLAICKVSLHQFFLAFGCDPIATSAVLRSPGPVVSVSNEFLPADDPCTLAPVARMRCTLAAGSADQIAHFNALMSSRDMLPSPTHVDAGKERTDRSDRKQPGAHRLTLTITELDQLYVPTDIAGDRVSSEADVFVAYQFPANLGLRGESGASRPDLKQFKTPLRPYQGPATVVAFGNDASHKHDFSAIDSNNLLADLVRSFSFLSSHSSTLGIDFVVSIRLYKPIVRDITVGLATLSLTRLASLITSSRSARHRQHVFVRLPVTPSGHHHPVGWLTVRLDYSSSSSSSTSSSTAQPTMSASRTKEERQGFVRICVRRAFGLRSAAKRLGIRVSTSSRSSMGFKTYCAMRTLENVTKSECEVTDRSFCPVFRMSQFDISPSDRAPLQDVEIQLFARDRHQGDLLIGAVTVPATIVDIVNKFHPRSVVSLTLPVCCDEAMTTSDFLMENVIGTVELDLQLPAAPINNLHATIPNWFQSEPRAKFSLFLDKIVVGVPITTGGSVDDVFRCRLSIGDSFSSPLSISASRPLTSSYNGEDVLLFSTASDSFVLEHAVPCPPLAEIVDYLAKSSAKIEVQFCGMTLFAFVPLLQLLTKQVVLGQYPLVAPGSADFFGSCVFARMTVEPLSASGSIKDRLTGRGTMKKESDCFVATVGVSRALHLPQQLLDENIYVVVGALEPLRTHTVAASDRPIWNFSAETLIPKDLIVSAQNGLVFRLMTTKYNGSLEEDPVIAFASIDLTSLSRGIGSVSGWYHLVDAFGHCLGQILVSVQPAEEVYQPPANKDRCSSALVIVPPHTRKSADEQKETTTDFGQPAQSVSVPPSQPPSQPPSTQPAQHRPSTAGFDMEQLEQLSRRIARLLAEPLPPRFATAENFTSTADLVPPSELPRNYVDSSMVTDLSADFYATRNTELPPQGKPFAPSVSSNSSRRASVNNFEVAKSVESDGGTESPDPVQMLFEVDRMLSAGFSAESPKPSSPVRQIIASVDHSLFDSNNDAAPCNPTISLKINNSTDFESEEERHFTMSPSVLERQDPIPEETSKQQDSASMSPPPLEVMSDASTEEWSHSACDADHRFNDEDLSRKADELFLAGHCFGNDNSSVEQTAADWSTILPHQMDSPHHSSSPNSARVSAKGQVFGNDEVPSYHYEQQPTSHSHTPRLDETLTNEQPSEDTFQRRSRRSPPAWLADANAKLSTALPSFFPHPDSLRQALERVRSQRAEQASSDHNSSKSEINTSSTRRQPPTFDVDEARRIARIFSLSN